MNVYLDIDGVILANEKNPARYAHEFLEFVTKNYDCYWLTTHCRGDASATVRHLKNVLSPETIKTVRDVQPTDWQELKTEAIDFSKPFLWFDDDLFDEERKVLLEHDVLDQMVLVDLAKNEWGLKDIVSWLKSR